MAVINVTHIAKKLLAGLFPANIETVARPQKETGGYCGYGAEHPEQEESNAISTNSTDVVFDKHNARIKGREEKNGSDARGDERGPENSYNALNDRDFVHAAIYYLKMRRCHYVCARIYRTPPCVLPLRHPRHPSMDFALRASLWLFKFDSVEFSRCASSVRSGEGRGNPLAAEAASCISMMCTSFVS